jgi:ribosomal protein S12 methylthiotransferase accessory factor
MAWGEEFWAHGFQLTALEVAKWVFGDASFDAENQVLTIDLRSGERTIHPFVRRPQCPVCGDPSRARKPSRVILSKGSCAEASSNYRTEASETSYRQHERHISPLTGVVRAVTRVETPGATGVHNYTVGHVSRSRHHSIESLRLATRDQSGGKGKTDAQARMSGLGEALERFSAVHDGDPPDVHAAYTALDRRAIAPNELLLFSDAQFRGRVEWNAAQRGHFQHVPEPYDKHAAIDWTQAWSLTRDEPCLVPSSYCYYGYEGVGTDYCRADSNGLAAGNTLEEAILQGFLELVERDAVAIWWYNRTQHPAIDLDSFADPYLAEMQKYYHSLDRELWVLDLTHDLEIPTFVGVSRRTGSPSEDILLGFGAHFDARLAVTRAILEVNQSLPAVLRSRAERERQLLPDFGDVLDWWDGATLDAHPYLRPSSIYKPVSASDFPVYESVDLAETIEGYVRKAAALGLETLVLDMTRPDIELPVARVIVPGLRHFWRRLAPGRLYEVPVALGRLPRASTEGQLNPVSLFL